MKLLFKLVENIFGYRFVNNHYIALYMESTFQKGSFLLLKNSSDY